MEYFDIVDEKGNPIGETVERSIAHRDGIRHRTAHIWIWRKTEKGYDVLLQKRSDNKDSFPGAFDTSSSGHIQAGDDILPSALRELKEELGLAAKEEDLTYIGTFPVDYETSFRGKPWHDKEVSFVFSFHQPISLSSLVLQEEEVSEVGWFDLETVYQERIKKNPKFCIPMGGLETIRRYLLSLPS